MTLHERLRELPSVDEVVSALAHVSERYPHTLLVNETRAVLDEMRRELRAGSDVTNDAPERVERRLRGLEQPSLRHVINATGVVLHTNLGRAPLSDFSPISGYTNLEYDLAAGRRGKRDKHTAALIERVAGAPGIVVNNNAAAVYLALNELAAGYEVIVSRGELIEIGDGFRIPDIMQRSGAVLREVGTTNRTRIEDYRDAISERTRLLLRVHPSNFRIAGFTAKPRLEELAALGNERGIPVYEDLGSGCVVDLRHFGLQEPVVADSIRAGARLVSFSGDKLLGGPQAGILAGDSLLVNRLRRNPMFRALRVDKLILQALETTLRSLVLERYEAVPALRMIAQSADELHERAMQFAGMLEGVRADVVQGESVAGGGATPEQVLPTWLVTVPCEDVVQVEKRCREGEPPVIVRVEDNKLVLDLRTVFEDEEGELARVIARAARA